MDRKKALVATFAFLFVAVTCFAQGMGNRGKTEMKAAGGSITIEYGRPALKGRDMLSKLGIGEYWRMGSNQATILTTPVDLTFGSSKVAKGSYSLWLKRADQEKFELVFNSQTGQWGTQRDAAKDVAQVPLKKESLASPVETLTIDLKEASKGGILTISWGTTQLSADFQTAQ